ncbi:stage II sporulation protein M [Bacillus sp. 1P06AnD]|uniref:stage II sporulation protein M n=1 Tax=Bacillus sp. 1P06AnD TaxID=3132208 RepID=UPI0039A0E4D0
MKKQYPFQYAANNHIREHSSLYVFIIILFLMGIICGAIIVNSLSINQKEDLLYYLTRFFGQVKDGNITASYHMFKGSISHNIQYMALIWILGISIIGIPLILILLFIKGVVIGFTVGFLVNSMGWGGFRIAFVSVLPQNIILVPLTIFITVLSLSLSIKIIQRIFNRQARIPLKPILFKYVASLIVCILFISCAGMIEAYVSPAFMKYMVSLIK